MGSYIEYIYIYVKKAYAAKEQQTMKSKSSGTLKLDGHAQVGELHDCFALQASNA